MRRRRTHPRQIRYLARLHAAGLAALTGYISRDVRTAVDAAARHHRVSRSTLLEAALPTALRLLTPSAIQHAAQQRKARASRLPQG